MVKIQKVCSFTTSGLNPVKLVNLEAIEAFLVQAGEMLKIKNASDNVFVRGAVLTSKKNKGRKSIVGGIVSEDTSIIIDTIPVERTLCLKIFYDNALRNFPTDVRFEIRNTIVQTFKR
ncbi:MAG: hypothetical protein NT170_03465 [Candidatus Moranbacteria bacterium]|nr:hypothetical protein [Candidatus Moranbacteria bacterium]